MPSRILKTGQNQITTKYSGAHKAVDVVKYNSKLDTIIAHSDGKVVFCQTGQKNNKLSTGNASYGNCVKIDHGDGYFTLYAHMGNVYVKLGETVKKGQNIGYMGNTGRSWGSHLHFEVRKDNVRIDPTPYLEADLPLSKKADINVTYKVYTSKWLPEVINYNNDNSNGYAGINGKAISGVMVKAEKGNVQYRVHQIDGNRWLPWVEDYKDYAGNLGKKIDAIQMRLVNANGYEIKYRVSPTNSKKWYGWCAALDDKTGDGYAGVFGKPIDCVQAEIIKL